MLEALTGKGGATSGGAHDETTSHLVACCPHGIACALETKHGIEHVNRNHRFALGGITRADRGEGCESTGLVDAGVQNLPLGALLVGQQQFAVYRRIGLSVGVVDLRGGEVGIHSKGAGFVRDDRHKAVTKVFVLE